MHRKFYLIFRQLNSRYLPAILKLHVVDLLYTNFIVMYKSSLLLLCILCNVANLFAQELPPIINYSTNDYQAGNQNWMIAQAANRNIYVANNNGLLEYNGAQWTLYPTPNGSIMRSVKCAGKKIYTGFYMDFGYWQADHTGVLKYNSIVKETGLKVIEDEQFWEIFIENDYILFQSLNAVYSYNLKSKTIKTIVSDMQIFKFFKVDEQYYFQDISKGLFEIKGGRAQLVSREELFKNSSIVKIFKSQSEILFITNQNEIYRLDQNKVIQIASNKFDKDVRVYSALLLPDGTLMVGTISHGTLNLSLDGTVRYHINASKGLANNTVLSFYQDRDSNIWVGLDNGLSCLNVNASFKMVVDENGTLGTVYTSFKEGSILYLGTNQGLFVKQSGDENFSLVTGTQGQVWSLKKIGSTLFCGHDRGTFLVSDTKASLIPNTAGVWDFQPLENFNDMVVQGTYSGLYVLERVGDTWKLKNKIAGFDISSKDFVVDGFKIYVSHEYKGLFELSVKPDLTAVSKMTSRKDLGKGITSDITMVSGDVVYANSNGIYIKAKGQNTFKRNDELSGLFADGFTAATLVNDANYSFWLFTENYVNKVIKQQINDQYKVESFPLPAYVRREKLGYENLINLKGDNYLLGSSRGFMTVDFGYNTSKSHDVLINKVSYVDDKAQILFDLSKPVLLSYKHNNLTIYVNTPAYESSYVTYYRYKMTGNSAWSPWTSNATFEFMNLDFGDYIFEVQSMINSEISANTKTLKITVERPFFLSNLAIACYLIVFIISFVLINTLYTRYYKKQREQALEQQQKSLELKNLEIEKDLIKLRNEKLRMDIDARNRELAVSTMSMIKKNETLGEIKVELEKLQGSTQIKTVKKLVEDNLGDKEDWITFEKAFNNVDKDFFKKIKELHPSLTSGDLRLCVYLRLNLSSKEIAPLLNISPRSVEIKRYRLRKKLDLPRDESLSSYIVEL